MCNNTHETAEEVRNGLTSKTDNSGISCWWFGRAHRTTWCKGEIFSVTQSMQTEPFGSAFNDVFFCVCLFIISFLLKQIGCKGKWQAFQFTRMGHLTCTRGQSTLELYINVHMCEDKLWILYSQQLQRKLCSG